MFSRTAGVSRDRVPRGGESTGHDNKGEYVVQDNAEGEGEVMEGLELRTLHDTVRHSLDDVPCKWYVDVGLRHSHERLEEPDEDDKEESEEDQTLLHHHPQDDEHCAEETEYVEVEHHAHPEHRSCEGKEVVAQRVEHLSPFILHCVGVRQRNDSQDK